MTLSHAILATLAYHDIFNYPLTKEEITRFLIGEKSTLAQVYKEIEKLVRQGKIGEDQGFFFLKNQGSIVKTRKEREKSSKYKLNRAKFYSKLLTLIPTVQFIGITGALAMNNSHQNDDIDLMTICSKGTLWTTRFFANVVLFPFKRKPQPNRLITHSPRFASEAGHYALITNNKACLNMFIDEADLAISPQNLYMAHEICQMKPIWESDKTYSRFIRTNKWIRKYLPNWKIEKSTENVEDLERSREGKCRRPREKSRGKMENKEGRRAPKKALVFSRLALVAESFLKKFQLWYMRSKITTEKIGEHQLFFHPQNTQDRALGEYQKRLQKLK